MPTDVDRSERLDKLEYDFDDIKKSVLLMGRDIHFLTESTKDIAKSPKVLANKDLI